MGKQTHDVMQTISQRNVTVGRRPEGRRARPATLGALEPTKNYQDISKPLGYLVNNTRYLKVGALGGWGPWDGGVG